MLYNHKYDQGGSIAMFKLKSVLLNCTALLVLASAGGCGKGDDTGTAKLKMSNTVNPGSGILWNPQPGLVPGPMGVAVTSAASAFKMKLISAYLAQDIDPTTGNNTVGTAMFYLNPDCAEDIMHCDISAGTAEDGAAYSHIVSTFFDFGQTSALVNTALNSQARSIAAATYKYVRLEFCKVNSASANNITWGAVTNTNQSFKRNSCTVNSAVMSPALTVAKGDAVTVNVAYSYAAAIDTGVSAQGDNCAGAGATKECFTLPTFTPTATK